MSSLGVANYIIEYAERHDYKLTCSKLQKVLYYVYGYYSAVFFRHLSYEDFEAWKYGPVLRTVYVTYCVNGSLPITCFDMNKNYLPEKFSGKEQAIVDYVLDQKLPMTLGELIDATTNEDPWVCHKGEIKDKPDITYMEMYEYFSKLPDVQRLKEEIECEEAVESKSSTISNFQWLHSLTPKELAKYLLSPWDCNNCPEGIELMDNPLYKHNKCSENCLKHCKEWLESEYKEKKR